MTRKITKFFAVMAVILQVMIMNVLPVCAAVHITKSYSGYKVTGDNMESAALMKKDYNGLPVYCIQPYVPWSTDDVYDVGYLEDYEKLSASIKRHIAEYSYFGYGYQGSQDGADYAAAQYLIWLEIDPQFVLNTHFYDQDTGENADDLIFNTAKRILNDVDSYEKEVNFKVSGAAADSASGPAYAGEGEAGQTIELDDVNGALAEMKLSKNDFGDALQINGNHVTINLSAASAGDREARFIRNSSEIGERPLMLKDSSSVYQTMTVRGDINKEASISLHTTLYAEITKTDEQGNNVIGASLQLTDADTGHIADTWISTAQPHKVSHLEGGHSYILKEDHAPIGYYYVSPETFQPQLKNIIQAVDHEITGSILKADENGKPLAGTSLELIDETDQRTLHFISGTVPYQCGDFLAADHHYRLKEAEAPTGYYQAKDIEFTAPHQYDGTPIEIVMKDAPIQYSIFKADENQHPVSGAQLSLYDVTGGEKTLVNSWLTGTDPVEIGHLLTAGHAYCVIEDDVSTKYFLAVDENFQVAEISDEEEEHNIVVTDNHIQYQLAKVDENGRPVKDARLLITDVTDTLDQERTVLDWRSTEEPLIINLFERGHVYRLQETEGPDGYYQAEDKYFKIPTYGEAQPILISCVNEHVVYRILKVDEQGNAVKDAELTVYEKSDGKETAVASFTTAEEAKILYGLKKGTDYVVKETKTPTGYYTAAEKTFHVNAEGNAQPIEIVMQDNTIQTVLRKVDLEGKRLSGAMLTIIDLESGETAASFTSAAEDIQIGNVLKPGHSYAVKEEQAPKGYYRSEDVRFTVPEHMQNDDSIEVEVKDCPIKGTVIKTDQDGHPLKNAHLVLMQGSQVLTEWDSEEEPKDISSYLASGETYGVKETKSPAGYYYAQPQTFTVEDAHQEPIEIVMKDQAVSYEIAKTDEKGNPVAGVQLKLTDLTEDNTVIRQWTTTAETEKFNQELSAEHQYLLEETAVIEGYHEAASLIFTVSRTGGSQAVIVKLIDETNEISFLKTDELGSPLAEAEMEILDQDGNITASFISTDDASGVALDRTGRKISSLLKSGETYILHEKAAPFGYQLCADISFVMDGTVSSPQIISVQNLPKTVFLKIDKRAAEGNMPLLADCEVTVYHQESNEPAYDLNGDAAKALTDENGAVRFNLPYASDGYYVKETKAPQGYAIDPVKKELPLDEEEFFHQETPQVIHVVDQKNVETGTELPYHAVMALLCMMGCFFLMKYPHEKI